MLRIALIAAVVGLAVCAYARRPTWQELSAEYTYERYIADFGKRYAPQEVAFRRPHFEANLAKILKHNENPAASYRMGVNHLTDMTEEETAAMRGARHEPTYEEQYGKPYVRKGIALPESLDYRRSFPPVLTAVKDQGNCGDCWAHSVTEAIESSYAISTGNLYVLSQQQITSCTPALGSCYSCNGSFPSLAFDYAAGVGVAEEWVYPFASYNGDFPVCNTSLVMPVVNITGYLNVAQNNAQDTMEALIANGPLAVLVDASLWSSYESGIFDGCSYSAGVGLDHAVNLVGYGEEAGKQYWLIRNSWSAGWGEHGFIRLLRTATPECGWNQGAGYSADCYGVGNATWACGMCGVLFRPQFPTVQA